MGLAVLCLAGKRRTGDPASHRARLHRSSSPVSAAAGRRFAAGERIHTENSYKYHAREFRELLARSGFNRVENWASQGEGFFVFYAR